ncbi:MAG: tetratricopeptide repeat protein [Prevotellaceae bacterium]|jgi:tetratricopeptide (TPR) repeat protein|nr:tetratricopeptide repeat protein [Prevotellaceae bacterium]
MKKFISILTIILFVSFVNAQDCNNESVTRFMARGKTAIKVAEKPEDYKLAANEFKKALEYAPKCADIYYQLGLCYEQMGKLDPGNYQEAISYFNNYLAYKPTAANKNEIQEKIYEIEFLAEKAGGVSLKSLVGKWKFYWGSGNDDDFFDIEIYENEGNLYAQDICDLRKAITYSVNKDNSVNDNGGYKEFKNEKCNNIIKYENGIISFKTEPFIGFFSYHPKEGNLSRFNEHSTQYWNLEYILKFENGKLVGERVRSKYVKKRYYNSEWETVTDCNGDCGENKVYFVKQ